MATPSCPRLFWHWASAATSRTLPMAGSSRPVRTPTMAMTTSSSTMVKPARTLERMRPIGHLPFAICQKRQLIQRPSVPDPYLALDVSRGEQATVSAEGKPGHGRIMIAPRQCQNLLFGLRVPYFQRAVEAGGGHAAAVRAEGHP